MTSNFRSFLAAIAAGVALVGGAHAQGGGAAKLQAIDANHDGMIDRAEAQAHEHLAQRFDQVDANRDGILSRDELMSWHQSHRGAGQGGGKEGHGFARFDTNGDGRIERNEVAGDPRAAARFDAADLNRDGIVTADEARAARAARHAQRTTTP